MRLAVLGLALALTASAPLAVSAQAPVTTQPLANGELLLQLGAIGVETVPADLATLSVTLTGQGETAVAARADLAGRYQPLACVANRDLRAAS